jgi:hypothetical protein
VSAPTVLVPLAVPSMAGVLDLLDDLTGLAGAAEGLGRRVEELTNLRSGELQALLAVARGADRTEVVGELTGQVDEAAAATLGALRRRGLVTGAHPAGWRLTDSGRVVRQQVEGLRIRVLHGIVGALGEEAAGEFRSTVQALSAVLSDEGASSATALPGP